MKKLALALLAFAASAVSPNVSQAAVPTTCPMSGVFETLNIIKCAGFYDDNHVKGSGDLTSAQNQDLNAFFGTTGVLYYDGNGIAKQSPLGGNDIASWDPLTLYGQTVIGIHWGNVTGPYGNVTAYFLVDAGAGTKLTKLMSDYEPSVSNAAIYYTQQCTAPNGCSTVPEPSGLALISAGFMGLGVMYRRRRKA